MDVLIQCLPTKTISPELAEIFTLLVRRMAHKPNFKEFPEQEDMAQDALTMLCRTWYHFDPTRGDNPFAYFTQCIHGSFLVTINRGNQKRAAD